MNKKENIKFLISLLRENNKKGSDKILSIYWFVILTLVAGGIFAMVYIFYGAPSDVREIEANLLAQKLADCVSKSGLIEENLFLNGDFNPAINSYFTDRCDITFDVEEDYGDEEKIQYFYKIEFYEIKDVVNPRFVISDGNLNWESECFIEKSNSKDYLRLVKCKERRFYAVDKGQKQYLIKILSGVGKSEKNVKQ